MKKRRADICISSEEFRVEITFKDALTRKLATHPEVEPRIRKHVAEMLTRVLLGGAIALQRSAEKMMREQAGEK